MAVLSLSKSLTILSLCLSKVLAAPQAIPEANQEFIFTNAPDAAPADVQVDTSDAQSGQAAAAGDASAENFFAPTVTIDFPRATIVGLAPSSTAPHSEEFPGIPFAQAPVGPLRLKPPQPITEPLGRIYAQKNGHSCPQFIFTTNFKTSLTTAAIGKLLDTPLFQKVPLDQSEDCLFLNVHRPKGAKEGDNLPVILWIFGGGFELGWNYMYDGSYWVEESLKLGEPIIFVTVNYRVGGFGFLPGKEILADGSANLGQLDQRLGMKWVADNIAAFGGDPEKVTLWGESAGAISIFNHMVAYDGDNTYKGKPLFRASIMNSGSAIPADPVDAPKPQAIYDQVVKAGGCAWSEDTLNCLRSLPYHAFLNAVNNVPALLGYSAVALSYIPRPDGTFLTASPDQLGLAGKVARVPFILGDQEDEGTLFALFEDNITTKAEVVDYLSIKYFNHASRPLLEDFVNLYDNIADYGSPFRTGYENNWYPQFKRLAAILGDLTFTITRRGVLYIAQGALPGVPFWSYLSSYDYGTPVLGTFHGSDLLQVFFGIKDNYASHAFHEYYINFANHLDPNRPGSRFPVWPQWSQGQKLLNMWPDTSQFIDDNFRQPVLDFLLGNLTSFYF